MSISNFRLSATHQAAFVALLVMPLEPNTRVKKRVKTHIAELPEGERQRMVQGALGLLNSLERKTSPLYVRLTQACAAFVLGCTDESVNLQVINSVAHQCKGFEKMLPPPESS